MAQSGFWHCYDLGYVLGVTPEAMENIMYSLLKLTTAATLLAATSVASHAAIKEISYPAIKVDLTPVHTPDAAFEKMRRELLDVIAKKDVKALSSFVGSTFVWLASGGVSGQFDFGRDALLNVKVAPLELVMPPFTELKPAYGMAVYSLKAILHGDGGEVLEMISENF